MYQKVNKIAIAEEAEVKFLIRKYVKVLFPVDKIRMGQLILILSGEKNML